MSRQKSEFDLIELALMLVFLTVTLGSIIETMTGEELPVIVDRYLK